MARPSRKTRVPNSLPSSQMRYSPSSRRMCACCARRWRWLRRRLLRTPRRCAAPRAARRRSVRPAGRCWCAPSSSGYSACCALPFTTIRRRRRRCGLRRLRRPADRCRIRWRTARSPVSAVFTSTREAARHLAPGACRAPRGYRSPAAALAERRLVERAPVGIGRDQRHRHAARRERCACRAPRSGPCFRSPPEWRDAPAAARRIAPAPKTRSVQWRKPRSMVFSISEKRLMAGSAPASPRRSRFPPRPARRPCRRTLHFPPARRTRSCARPRRTAQSR